LTLDRPCTSNREAAIRALTSATANVKVTTFFPGATSNNAFVTTDRSFAAGADGTIPVYIDGLSPLPTLLNVEISGGSISNATSFRGAADLSTGANTIIVTPRGTRLARNIVGYVLESLAANNPGLIANAPVKLVAAISAVVARMQRTSDSSFDAALSFIAERLRSNSLPADGLVASGSATSIVTLATPLPTQVWVDVYVKNLPPDYPVDYTETATVNGMAVDGVLTSISFDPVAGTLKYSQGIDSLATMNSLTFSRPIPPGAVVEVWKTQRISGLDIPSMVRTVTVPSTSMSVDNLMVTHGTAQPVVSGPAPAARFSRDSSGIVTDNVTNLQWQEGPDSATTIDAMRTWISSLGQPWRAPSWSELHALYIADTTRVGGMYPDGNGGTLGPYAYHIDPVFRLTLAYLVWCEPSAGSNVWLHNFINGRGNAASSSLSWCSRAFAVRSRQ